jgi:von Willebrand factor type A domain
MMRAQLVVLAGFAAAAWATFAGCSRGTPAGFADDAGADAPAQGAVDAKFGPPEDAAYSLLEAGCATATAKVFRDPIYMLMVLDGSGSMADEQKWQAIVPALEAFVDDLADQNDVSFGVGLTVFSDSLDKTGGVGPYAAMDVPIAYVDSAHALSLRARIDPAKPNADTPTVSVLSGQYPLLEAFTPQPPLLPNGKKVLVFMSDGVPHPDPDGTAKAKSIQMVKDELAKNVLTFSVGIGYTFPYDPLLYDPLFMAQVALGGGTAPQGCNPTETKWAPNMCHFQITPVGGESALQLEQEMLIAFDKIRATVTSCELTLDKTGYVDPFLVNVVFTDAHNLEHVIVEDPKDGWSYDNPTDPKKVILNGQSCQEMKDNPRGRLVVVLGCKTITK